MMEKVTNIVAKPGESVRSVRKEETLPNARRMIGALRQIGYSLEQALSDLLDNSINADAKNVLIRFVHDDKELQSIVIADDGCGMTEAVIRNAMKFGSEQEADPHSLGKYGMGLKLASLSYARTLTVITRRSGRAFARRWTIEGIERGWKCDVLNTQEAAAVLDAPWGPVELGRNGTLVVWDRIDKLRMHAGGLKQTLKQLQRRLQIHIGLCFHRFIEDGRLIVTMDQQRAGEQEHGIRSQIPALNPFLYAQSGHPEFPMTFRVSLNGLGTLRMEAHIWPPNSEETQYKLGGQAASKQGFFFYRNDRLIQAGGWNGIVQHESEPHSSLARVRVDLPEKLDAAFGLNVQKSAVIVPPAFAQSIHRASSGTGETFDDFRRHAQKTYRRKDDRAKRSFPLVPSVGIPKSLSDAARESLNPQRTRSRKVKFLWEDFTTSDIFRVDAARDTILLNKAYRKHLLRGDSASKADLPAFKMLLFFLVQGDLNRDRMSAVRKQELSQINKLLGTAVLFERG